jgi:cellulose biosynthesis protein BcsQ
MIEGVLISLYNGRRAIERTIAETLRTAAGVRVLDVFIRDSAKYREAITARQPITRYKPSSPEAETFRELARIVEPSLGQQQEAFDVHHVHAGSH